MHISCTTSTRVGIIQVDGKSAYWFILNVVKTISYSLNCIILDHGSTATISQHQNLELALAYVTRESIPADFEVFGPYIFIPLIGGLAWFGGVLALLLLWVTDGKPRYRGDEASVVFISDVGAVHKVGWMIYTADIRYYSSAYAR